MLTTILTRADVSRHVEALTLMHELKQALISGGASTSLQTAGANAVLREAAHPAIPARSTCSRSNGRSILQLFDATSGKLLALMDAEGLFTLRASLVAAIAVDALATPEAKKVAVLGAGPTASGALKALRLVRSLREIWLVAPEFPQAIREAMALQQTLKTPVRSVERAADAVQDADVILLTGGVDLPEVALWPSVHLSVVSAERFSSLPLTTGMSARAWRVSEEPGSFWGVQTQAELREVLAGTAARPSGGNTLFIGAGPSWLDLLCAWHVYQGAQADEGLTRIDFEA